MSERLITILGPTACGKTALAVALAYELSAEIISADSRQVYCNMDIGTGKDLNEYNYKGKLIPYHLINIAQPGTKYNLYEYQKDFHKVYVDLQKRNINPILCGGSGLYIEAVLKGYELPTVTPNQFLRASLKNKSLEELTEILTNLKYENKSHIHNITDFDSCQRAIRAIEIEDFYLSHPKSLCKYPPIESLIIGLKIDREHRRQRITDRLVQRLNNGLPEEITNLINSGVNPEDLIYYGLEYKYVTEYVMGKISFNDMFAKLEIAIHQFAKRQMTWFRGMERRGFIINWIDALDSEEKNINKIKHLLWQ